MRCRGGLLETVEAGAKSRGTLFRAYLWLKNYGSLPSPGGFGNQLNRFIKAVELCDYVGKWYAGKTAEKEQAKAKLNQQASRMTKHGR